MHGIILVMPQYSLLPLFLPFIPSITVRSVSGQRFKASDAISGKRRSEQDLWSAISGKRKPEQSSDGRDWQHRGTGGLSREQGRD